MADIELLKKVDNHNDAILELAKDLKRLDKRIDVLKSWIRDVQDEARRSK